MICPHLKQVSVISYKNTTFRNFLENFIIQKRPPLFVALVETLRSKQLRVLNVLYASALYKRVRIYRYKGIQLGWREHVYPHFKLFADPFLVTSQ